MTLNELKVQVECKQDVEYLLTETTKYLATRNDSVPEEDTKKFIDAVFKIVCENVQVGGVDYEETEAQEEIEPVDEGLLKELEQLQQETESVLAQVVRHRRSFPGKSLDKLSKELSALLEETHESTYIGQLEAPEQPDDSLLSRLSAGVEKSVKLQSDIPQVIAKLERARTVLHEQGQKRASEMKKPATEWSLAVGDNDAITGFNDVLTRHRRTSHQFDLAHKLSSWN